VRSLTCRIEQGYGLSRLRQGCPSRQESMRPTGQLVSRAAPQGTLTRR